MNVAAELKMTRLCVSQTRMLNNYFHLKQSVCKRPQLASIIFIAFVQGNYNYVPKTNHVTTVYSFAALLYLQFVLHVMLFRMLNMFCTFTLALPAVYV